MKKLALITIWAGIILLSTAGVAFANAGPHGGYAYQTDGCATCHSIHTSYDSKLMKFDNNPLNPVSTQTDVCYMCHNGTGATTNVEQGMIGTFTGSPGGPFEMKVPSESKTVTSAHLVGQTYPTVPGGYTTVSGSTINLVNFNFQCSSCHNPHGSVNSRLIKTTINGFSVTFQENIISGVSYTNSLGGTSNDGVTALYKTDMSTLCNGCHGAYSNSGTTTMTTHPTTGFTVYIHRGDFDPATGRPEITYDPAGTTTNSFYPGGQDPYLPGGYYNTAEPPEFVQYESRLPLQNNTVKGAAWMTCQTCHYAHGTRVAAPPSSVFQTDAGTGVAHDSSSLLRNPGREVCSKCHGMNAYY